MTKSPIKQVESPTQVDATLDYIKVEDYDWPKPEPIKRFRLDEEERKRRHREGQRQFMSRKRSRIHLLRREIALLELRLKWIEAKHEQQILEQEKNQLRRQLPAGVPPLRTQGGQIQYRRKKQSFVGPAENEVLDSREMETLLVDALLSW